MEKTMMELIEKKKKTGAILAGAVVIALIGAGIWSFSENEEAKQEDMVQGSVKVTEINLNSKLPGNVEEILVAEGDEVKAGQVIMKIGSDTIEAKLKQAEAAKAAAAAQANKAHKGARSQEVVQAKAAYDYAQKTYDRMSVLLKEEAISQATFDQVEAQYIAARETYNMALEGARSEDVAAANSLVAQADGAIAEVSSYLEDSQIKAPKDGIISGINVNEGELISTGMPLATVISNEIPWVEINVKETDLDKIYEGKKVNIKIPAYEGENFTGTVTLINKKPDFATKKATNKNGDFDVLSYGVKVEFEALKHKLYQGMTVMVDLSESAEMKEGK